MSELSERTITHGVSERSDDRVIGAPTKETSR
jgi:hypothetical protein